MHILWDANWIWKHVSYIAQLGWAEDDDDVVLVIIPKAEISVATTQANGEGLNSLNALLTSTKDTL